MGVLWATTLARPSENRAEVMGVLLRFIAEWADMIPFLWAFQQRPWTITPVWAFSLPNVASITPMAIGVCTPRRKRPVRVLGLSYQFIS